MDGYFDLIIHGTTIKFPANENGLKWIDNFNSF